MKLQRPQSLGKFVDEFENIKIIFGLSKHYWFKWQKPLKCDASNQVFVINKSPITNSTKLISRNVGKYQHQLNFLQLYNWGHTTFFHICILVMGFSQFFKYFWEGVYVENWFSWGRETSLLVWSAVFIYTISGKKNQCY